MRFFNKNKSLEKPRTVVIDSLRFKAGNTALPFVFQAILLCVTLVGFLYCVATSVDMPIGLPMIMLIAVPIMLVSMLLTLNTKIYIGYASALGLFSVLVFTVIKGLRQKIIESFIFCYNLTAQIMVDQGYDYQNALTEDITEYLDNPIYMEECFYTVILTLAVVFSFIFASTLMKRSLVLLSALPCFAILTPSLYFGATPSGIAFSIFISGILGCYIESISFNLKNKKKKSDTKTVKKETKKKTVSLGRIVHTSANGAACMCISLVLSLTVSLSLFSSEGMQINSIRELIDRLANRIMNVLFYESFETSDGAIGGLIEGDTLELKTPEFRDLPVMTVTTEKNSSLYLRGWIGKDLAGDGWKILGENDTNAYVNSVSEKFIENSQFYNYTKIVSPDELKKASTDEDTAKLGFIYDTVDVKAKYSKSMMVFTPVKCLDGNIIANHSGLETIGDTITFFEKSRPKGNAYKYIAALQTFADRDFYLKFNSNQSKYLSYSDSVLKKSGALTETEQFISDERNYAKYVQATYMSLPTKSDKLRQIALTETSSYDKKIAKVLAIERYFKTNYNYAQKLSYEGDAIDKVISMIDSTSKEGYCTYYATAMTIMVRHLGIPARYVTGYHAMISEDIGAKEYVRQIKDENYHAWVEVYFDGIGWLTFDPTPGMSSTVSVRDYDYLDDAEWEDPEPDVLPDNGDDPATEAPLISAPVTPVAPNESEITDIIGSDDEEDKQYKYDKEIPQWVVKLIIAFVVVAAIVGALVLLAFLINTKHRSYISGLHNLAPRELICTVYPDMLRLLSSLKLRPNPGEMMGEFVDRVDKELCLPITLKSIIKTLEMSQFSNNEIDFKSASRAYEYYNLLSDSVYRRLNRFKRYYYKLTLKKKKY